MKRFLLENTSFRMVVEADSPNVAIAAFHDAIPGQQYDPPSFVETDAPASEPEQKNPEFMEVPEFEETETDPPVDPLSLPPADPSAVVTVPPLEGGA